MRLSDLPFFPYPSDPQTKFGFILGDIIVAGIFLLLAVAIFPTLIR